MVGALSRPGGNQHRRVGLVSGVDRLIYWRLQLEATDSEIRKLERRIVRSWLVRLLYEYLSAGSVLTNSASSSGGTTTISSVSNRHAEEQNRKDSHRASPF
jgi:hypothetical protein